MQTHSKHKFSEWFVWKHFASDNNANLAAISSNQKLLFPAKTFYESSIPFTNSKITNEKKIPIQKFERRKRTEQKYIRKVNERSGARREKKKKTKQKQFWKHFCTKNK